MNNSIVDQEIGALDPDLLNNLLEKYSHESAIKKWDMGASSSRDLSVQVQQGNAKQLKGSQRKQLRSLAHNYKPFAIIGKNELNDGSIKFINNCLDEHELIKVKFNDRTYMKSLIQDIEKILNCNIVGDIGKTLILFRYNIDDERKINI